MRTLRTGLPSALLALAAACTFAPCQGQGQDSQVKAAFILNIALFTAWPPLPEPARALTVCASPQHILWESLRQLDGRHVNGRIWTTVDTAAGNSCDINVVAAASAPRSAPKTSGSTLYVVDGATQGKYAGAIVLIEEDQHVRFDVDTREAARVGITFSSRLLRLARNVV
jgi:hypothetical protein